MIVAAEKMIKLTIDNREVSVPEGITILAAAKKLGIDIPTLCHNQSLAPYGSCWICAVKVEGARTLVPSCSTRVSNGMKVITLDDEIRQTRRLCTELLLSDHHGDCLGPCQMTCPAGIDVQGYIAHVARHEYREALELIKKRNPLPLICGRVCPRPCEDQCRRNLVDQPVAVDAIKRFVADLDRESGEHYVPPVAQATGKKVAVVGGGPAGLTCAYFLAQRGHSVTVFEALPKLGGMLVWGIPAYRLPRDVLADEINTVLELGVEAKCNMRFGQDFNLESLKKDGFAATFLGLGATESRSMRVEGEELAGVMSGTVFLREFGLGKEFDFKAKKVAVIGGGNTAIDAARTSLRLGAEEVTIIYRRSRSEMPAQDIEVEDAEKEGVKFHFLAAPTRITGNVKIENLEYVRMELGEPDQSGRRRPLPVAGSEKSLPLDICIAAIGQIPDLAAIAGTELQTTSWGALQAAEDSLQTAVEGVFAGGDCVNGAATVVEAVAHGREAAISIDNFLHQRSVKRKKNIFNISKGGWQDLNPADFEHFLKTPRQHMSCLSIAKCVSGFAEIEQGLSEKQVQAEAGRCLECGCAGSFDCTVRKLVVDYDSQPERFGGDSRKEQPDERHPLIRLEMQKCIMCGACVRACDEVHGVRALGFVGRGFSARVRPAFGSSLLAAGCISCGGCVDICPTGAITEIMGKEGGPFVLHEEETVCSGCGVGCLLEARLTEKGKLITLRTNREDESDTPNRGALCRRGHFAHRVLGKNDLLLKPMLRKNGKLEEVSWQEALQAAVDLLKGAVSKTRVLISSHAPTAEAVSARSLAEVTQGVAGSFGLGIEKEALQGLNSVLAQTFSPATVRAIPASDCLVLIENNPLLTHHVAGVQILAAKRRGAKLIIISSTATPFAKHADLYLKPKSGFAAAVLGGIIAENIKSGCANLTSQSQELANLDLAQVESASEIAQSEIQEVTKHLQAANNPLIIINCVTAAENLASAAALLAGTLSDKTDELPLLALRGAANAHALGRLGIEPLGEVSGEKEVILAIREDVLAAGSGYNGKAKLVVLDGVKSKSSEKADIVIPLPTLLEVKGRVFATGGLKAELSGSDYPQAGSEAAQALVRLCKMAGTTQISDALPKVNFSFTVPQDLNLLVKDEKQTFREEADSFQRLFLAWVAENKLA